MNSQDFRNLQEAYLGVYDELDEAAKRSPKRVRGSKDTQSYQDGRSQAGMMVSGDSQVSGAGYMRRGGGIQTQTDPNERQPQQGRMDPYTRDEMEYRKARLKKEETDLYDIILSHLLDEGYAETQEAAEAIMVNMSEEWRECIVEAPGEWFGGLRDRASASRAAQMQSSQPTPKPLPSSSSPFAKPASRDDSGKLTTYGAGGGAAAERAGQTRAQVMQQGAKNLETRNKSNPGPNFGRL